MKGLHFFVLATCLLTSFRRAVADEEVKLVTWEQLSPRTGKDGSDIWLSIMGEVFDVTAGREFYDEGTSYHSFTGNDSSVPYCTGTFTAEEAEKSPTTLSNKDLGGLLSWVQFYRDHETYEFKGFLIDPRYYDEEGKQTAEMEILQARIKVVEEEKAQKKAERIKKKAERAAQKLAKEKADKEKAEEL
mmetsp:Transcript_54545/g.82640  ORF Transcript_54545/g.82640 Transcript_54545/m.82640 type:complete len:188 (-) Transcript_54545:132-695(-)